MREATPAEIARWDQMVAGNPDGGNPLQLKAFGETKSRHGWTPRYLMMGKMAVLVLSRRIPQLGDFWYVPKGPGVDSAAALGRFASAVSAIKLGRRPFAVRIDPELHVGALSLSALQGMGMVPSTRHIQYNIATAIVDLKPSEEAIMALLKQKTRYNVRLAHKKGVTVAAVPTDDDTIGQMYYLTQVTTSRAGVYLREKAYFADFWRLHAQSGHGQMFFASYENQVLAGAFVTYVGRNALYKDGGSVREHPEVQAPYALQWEIIRWLKGRGVASYDLHGTPPAAEIDNPAHPLAGLARFKTGFQPNITEFVGTYDIVLSARAYAVWRRIGERLAVTFQYRAKKRLFY